MQSESWYVRAIELATKLGFWDDVDHWTAELNKLRENK